MTEPESPQENRHRFFLIMQGGTKDVLLTLGNHHRMATQLGFPKAFFTGEQPTPQHITTYLNEELLLDVTLSHVEAHYTYLGANEWPGKWHLVHLGLGYNELLADYTASRTSEGRSKSARRQVALEAYRQRDTRPWNRVVSWNDFQKVYTENLLPIEERTLLKQLTGNLRIPLFTEMSRAVA